MNKNEFIEKLQRALAAGLGSSQVADNVRYYQEYIESEIRKGRTEEEVLSSLGDPRLLAKSIIEANKRAGESYGSNREFDDEVEYKSIADRLGWLFGHIMILPRWLVVLIVGVIFVIIIGLITRLLYIFAPIIIAALIVLLIVKLFQGSGKV